MNFVGGHEILSSVFYPLLKLRLHGRFQDAFLHCVYSALASENAIFAISSFSAANVIKILTSVIHESS